METILLSFFKLLPRLFFMVKNRCFISNSKKTKSRLLVSRFARKEFRNRHSALASNKLNRLKGQQLLLDPREERGHRANLYPQGGRDWQMNPGSCFLPEQRLKRGRCLRNKSQGRKTWKVVVQGLVAQCRWQSEWKFPWLPAIGSLQQYCETSRSSTRCP